MARRWYRDHRFQGESRQLVSQANTIIEEYAAQGFTLTLRQLYYQFVSRGYLANRQESYNRLGNVVSDARMAGLIDWEAIEDRTRFLRSVPHWNDPSDIIDAAAKSFRIDKWADQPYYCEVWIEKDALLGVIEGVCRSNDVSYFAARGYNSMSEMWEASQRMLKRLQQGKKIKLFHLGDHDPSGIDMTRDNEERLFYFLAVDIMRMQKLDSKVAVDLVRRHFEVERLALNWDQVQTYQPPPNPAKLTDSRARGYIAEYGGESWELDALEPSVLAGLISGAIGGILDEDAWTEQVEKETSHRSQLDKVASRWSEVINWLEETE